MTESMPEGWTPRHRGRKPLVNVVPLMSKVQAMSGAWVAFNTYSDREAVSIRRQMTQYGFEVSIENLRGKGGVTVYIRWPETTEEVVVDEVPVEAWGELPNSEWVFGCPVCHVQLQGISEDNIFMIAKEHMHAEH